MTSYVVGDVKIFKAIEFVVDCIVLSIELQHDLYIDNWYSDNDFMLNVPKYCVMSYVFNLWISSQQFYSTSFRNSERREIHVFTT